MNTQAQEVPLIELLKAVPKTARLIVESEDGISSRAHPVGDLCHKAAEALEQPAQEPVAWMKSAIDNARDVCKYLDHGRINDAMAHTKFFWADLDKIKEVEDALSNSDTI